MKRIKYAIRQSLRQCGFYIRRINPHEASDPQGRICRVRHCDVEMLFFVSDEWDYVMGGYHKNGILYEKEELDAACTVYHGGDIVDIGANIGNHTIFLGKSFPEANIISVEPGNKQRKALEINLIINDLYGRVEIERVAFSDHDGQSHMTQANMDSLGTNRLNEGNEGEIVPVRRGDAILAGRSIGLVKIDVEGHEYKVLSGLSETIRSSRPGILVEVFDKNMAEIEGLLLDLGYVVQNRFPKPDGTQNLVCCPVKVAAEQEVSV